MKIKDQYIKCYKQLIHKLHWGGKPGIKGNQTKMSNESKGIKLELMKWLKKTFIITLS